jgi:hypothetical protein
MWNSNPRTSRRKSSRELERRRAEILAFSSRPRPGRKLLKSARRLWRSRQRATHHKRGCSLKLADKPLHIEIGLHGRLPMPVIG